MEKYKRTKVGNTETRELEATDNQLKEINDAMELHELMRIYERSSDTTKEKFNKYLNDGLRPRGFYYWLNDNNLYIMYGTSDTKAFSKMFPNTIAMSDVPLRLLEFLKEIPDLKEYND